MTPNQPDEAPESIDWADPVSVLDVICDPRLEPMFRLPDRRGTNSAWWGHVPFAAWLVKAARPRCIVELGSHSGVSYAAFCQSVLFERLNCACHAVDTWGGDAQSGHYGEEVFQDFMRYHDAHYKSISTLHRCTFNEAVSRFPDGSIDILHIDGLHTYEAVRHDFETWLPKLSPRGVVLFHDATERKADFGVWRFWDEVSARWPGFLFLHSHGLGVLAVGPDMPPPVRALCVTGASRTALLRSRFGLLGNCWYAQAQWEVAIARATIAETERQTAAARAAAAETETDRLRGAEARLIATEAKLMAIETSTTWRATAVIRSAGSHFLRAVRQVRHGLRLGRRIITLRPRCVHLRSRRR